MLRKLALFGGLAAIAGCADASLPAARYDAADCRRVTVFNPHDGTAIRGAEDFAHDRERGRLYFSAYDRRAVERAARRGAASIPEGGVFAIDLDAVFDDAVVEPKALASPGDVVGGLRPHGVAFDAAHHELIFVNRTYEKNKRRWTMTPKLQRVGANGEVFVGAASAAPCTANDVVAVAGDVLTSFDHAGCDWRAAFEDVLKLRRSGFVGADLTPLFAEAAYANGIATTTDGYLALAATRDRAVYILQPSADGLRRLRTVETPGGPDNLTSAEDGGLIAALHPDIIRLALNRKLGVGRAPSRIVRISPHTGAVDILFDDPSGALYSAASVAVETPRGLILGSATDDGLLVCARPA